MTKGWCPEEDIYNKDITARKVTMTFSDLNFTISAIITHSQEQFVNIYNNKTFPGLHANFFNVFCLDKDG